MRSGETSLQEAVSPDQRRDRDERVCINITHPSLHVHKGRESIQRNVALSSQTPILRGDEWERRWLEQTYLVSLAHRILQPSLGITRPRCIRSLQLVGPVCGHTWVPGCMMEYLICVENITHRSSIYRAVGELLNLKWQYKITVNLDWAFVRLRINILLSFLCEGIKIKYSLFARSYIYTEHFHPQFWHQPHEIVSKRGIRWAEGHKHLFVIIHIPLLPVSSCVLPSTENTLGTCPLRHPVVSGNLSSKEQVLGAPLQAFSFFLPRTINDKSIVRNESQYNSDSSCLDPHVIYNVILTVVMRRLHTHTETMCFAPLDTDLQSKD